MIGLSGDTEVALFEVPSMTISEIKRHIDSGECLHVLSIDHNCQIQKTQILRVEREGKSSDLCRLTVEGKTTALMGWGQVIIADYNKTAFDLVEGEMVFTLEREIDFYTNLFLERYNGKLPWHVKLEKAILRFWNKVYDIFGYPNVFMPVPNDITKIESVYDETTLYSICLGTSDNYALTNGIFVQATNTSF